MTPHEYERSKYIVKITDEDLVSRLLDGQCTEALLFGAADRIEGLNSKLAKAVAALREIESITVHSGVDINGVRSSAWRNAFEQAQSEARAVLCEIKGETK